MNKNTQEIIQEKKWMYRAPYLWSTEDPVAQTVITHLVLEPDSVVLDFGAGSGRFSIPVARRLEELGGRGVVFAVDYSERLIAELERRAAEEGLDHRIRAVPMSWMKSGTLPIMDTKASRVLAVNSVHVLANPRPVYEEFARILAPGGMVLVAEWRQNSVNRHLEETSAIIAQDLAAQGFWIAGEVDIDNIAFAMRAWKLF